MWLRPVSYTHLDVYKRQYDNLMDSVNRARQVELHALIYSLGIPNIGTANAKLICKHFQNDFDKIRNAAREELVEIKHIRCV